jgi:hypothetical protein
VDEKRITTEIADEFRRGSSTKPRRTVSKNSQFRQQNHDLMIAVNETALACSLSVKPRKKGLRQRNHVASVCVSETTKPDYIKRGC